MSDVSDVSDVALAETEGRARIDAAHSVEALRAVEAEVVGRRSRLASLQQGLGSLPPDERRLRGRQLNEARATRSISQRTHDLAAQQLELTKETIRLQQQLLAIANETLTHVRNIDAKTPSAPAAAAGVVDR